MAKNVVTDASAEENAKLEAIKQIIFGQNMKEYEKEFNEIRDYINLNLNAIDKKMAETSHHFEDLNTKMNAKVDELNKKINEKIDALNKQLNDKMDANHKELITKLNQLDEAKTDRKLLGKMLKEIGEKISA